VNPLESGAKECESHVTENGPDSKRLKLLKGETNKYFKKRKSRKSLVFLIRFFLVFVIFSSKRGKRNGGKVINWLIFFKIN
jgi:hypothetical protein